MLFMKNGLSRKPKYIDFDIAIQKLKQNDRTLLILIRFLFLIQGRFMKF